MAGIFLFGLFLFFLLLLFGLGVLEVGDAGLDEDVVPGDELLDVTVLHAVLIPLGEYLAEIVAQLLARCFLLVDAGRLAALQVLHVLKDVHQGHIVGLGKHGDVAQRGDAVGGEGGHSLVGIVERLDNQVVVSSGNEFVESGLAGDC